MDSTSPIAACIAGQTSADSANTCKPILAMGLLTLVDNLFAGRRWNFRGDFRTGGHRRYRDYHYRSAGGYGQAS